MLVPRHLSSPAGLFRELVEFVECRLVLEDGCLWWLEPVESPLSMRPLALPFFRAEILLACERNLNVYASKTDHYTHLAGNNHR